jgi:hypothetical protein
MHMSEDFYCEEVLSGRTPVQNKHLHFHLVFGHPLNKN